MVVKNGFRVRQKTFLAVLIILSQMATPVSEVESVSTSLAECCFVAVGATHNVTNFSYCFHHFPSNTIPCRRG